MRSPQTFARRVFQIAGIYGILVIAPQYFMEGRIGVDSPPPITHPEYFFGFIGVALAWQVLFFVIAHDVIRYRVVMLPAALEKITFGVAALVLYVQSRLAFQVLAFGLIDLLLAALFLVAFMVTGREPVNSVRTAP